MLQELLARLGEHDFFAQSVQKTTARFAFQGLHRVANPRLRQVQLACGLREAARARQHTELLQPPGIYGFAHI